MDLNALIADQMGLFTLPDIGNLVVGMLLAAVLAYVLGVLVREVEGPTPREMAVLAAVVALAVGFVRASLPMAVALVAAALLVRGPQASASWRGYLARLAALTVGVGCGFSAGVPVLAAFIPLALLLRWSGGPKRS
ncbi:MAG: hypothetical protein JNM31_15735 [Flavobacteriales bacterium]|nr:hypothetical protein [Flavobacteriales bacterium]